MPYLRLSRARYHYRCARCEAELRKGQRYFRDEPGFVNLPDAGRVAGQDPNLGGCSRSTRHHVPFGERSGAERAVMNGS